MLVLGRGASWQFSRVVIGLMSTFSGWFFPSHLKIPRERITNMFLSNKHEHKKITLPPIIIVQWKMGPSNSSYLSSTAMFHWTTINYGRKSINGMVASCWNRIPPNMMNQAQLLRYLVRQNMCETQKKILTWTRQNLGPLLPSLKLT